MCAWARSEIMAVFTDLIQRGGHTQCLLETYKVKEGDRYVKLPLFFPCVYYVSYL